MQAYMNINVRVMSAQALAQMRAMEAQLAAMKKQIISTNAASASSFGGSRNLAKFGSQLQWTGRQIQYNWTLPLLLAGGAAVKFSLDNEKAMTRVKKVYGDASEAAAQFNKEMGLNKDNAAGSAKWQQVLTNETNALGDAFEALSNKYGVNRAEVIETASAWAAAGSSGVALAKSTELSIRTSVLGDMDLEKATKSLISVQAQYSLSTKGLNLALAELNAIENQTAISMPDLIDGFTRAAGVARESGVDIRHLGAMLAALVPATGTAATAGNALKTIISRLMSPTKDAADVMHEFGVETSSAAWNSSTAMERLEVLAKHMGGTLKKTGGATKDVSDDMYQLSDSQKQVVASVLGSRYQMNRFLVLMRELDSEHGNYQKALDATKNHTKSFAQADSELQAVLTSNPQRLKILWTTIQNGMADAIQPLIPYLLYMVHLIQVAVDKFKSLDPALQKFFLFLAVGIALMGPLLKYFGSLITLVIYLGKALFFPITGIYKLVTAQVTLTLWNRTATFSLAGFARALLVMPFVAAAKGFELIWLGMMKLAAITRLTGLFSAAWGLIVAVTKGGVLKYIALTTLASVYTAAKWALGMAIMVTSTAASWLAVNGIQAAGAGISLALQAGWNAAKIALDKAWTAVALTLTVAYFAAYQAIQAAWAYRALIAQAVFQGAALALQKGYQATVLLLQGGFLAAMSAIGSAIAAVLLSPWGVAIALVILLLVKFHTQVTAIWNNIVSYFSDTNNSFVSGVLNAWNALPQGVQNALMAVVNIVKSAATAIYGWFSYINPFAHHSPSLVENVTLGMRVVKDQFKGMASAIGNDIAGAYASIKRFGVAAKGLLNGAANFQQLQDEKKIGKFAPGLLDEYKDLASHLVTLNADMVKVQSTMDAQQKVVDKYKNSLDGANAALDVQQRKLDALQKVQDRWSSRLDAANDKLTKFSSAPIEGMRKMSDAIFDNEIAQKKLRLEMMKMEDATGPLDDIKDRMDKINGAQELLRGKRTDLAAGGAGSNITATYDKQIAALDKQKKSYSGNQQALSDMQKQLDALGRTADELDLENSLKFDPLTRQIDQLANGMKEMPFNQIIVGVKASNVQIKDYTSHLRDANQAVKAQQAIVDAQTKARDAIQRKLDAEQAVLDGIKKRYDAINDAVSAVNKTMQDAVSAADAMKSALDAAKAAKNAKTVSPAVQNFRNAKGGNFANVAPGDGLPDRKNWTDQSKAIEKFTDKLKSDTTDAFGSLNPFAPFKEKFQQFKKWWGGVWGPFWSGTKDAFSHMFDGVDFGGGGGGIAKKVGPLMDQMKVIWVNVKSFIDGTVKVVQRLWRLFWPSIKEIAKNAIDGLSDAWKQVGPQLAALWDELGPFLKALKPILAFMILRFAFLGKLILSVMAKTIKPALQMIGGVLGNVLRIIRGVMQVIEGVLLIFTGHWKEAFQKLSAGVGNIVRGLFVGIWDIIKGFAKIIVGAIWGIVKGVFDWFYWLWDELIGHSIIPDIINGIFFWFNKLVDLAKWIYKHVVQPVIDAFKWLFNKVIDGVKLWWSGIKAALATLLEFGGWIRSKVLQPVIDAFSWVWGKIKALVHLWWSGIMAEFKILTTLGQWVYDHVLKPVWDKFGNVFDRVKDVVSGAAGFIGDKFTDIKNLVSDMIGAIADAPGHIKDLAKDFLSAGASIMTNIVNGIKGAAGYVGDIAKNIGNTMIDMLNGVIHSLNSAMEFDLKIKGVGVHINPKDIDDIPHFSTGGHVRGRGTGTSDDILARLSNGEFVVNAKSSRNNMDLIRHINKAGKSGSVASDLIPSSTASNVVQLRSKQNASPNTFRADMIGNSGARAVINIYGNLEFPNIKNGEDAEAFITNLESLAG